MNTIELVSRLGQLSAQGRTVSRADSEALTLVMNNNLGLDNSHQRARDLARA